VDKSNGSNPTIYIYLRANETLDGVDVRTDTAYIGQHVTFQEVVSDYVKYVHTKKDFNLIAQGNATLGGQPAYKIVYTANAQNWWPNVNETLQIMYVFGMNNNGRVCSVAYSAVPNDYDAYLPQAQQVTSSFSYT
jgi:hypothetical protein